MSGDLRTGWKALRTGPEKASGTIDTTFTGAATSQLTPARSSSRIVSATSPVSAVVQQLRRDPGVRDGTRFGSSETIPRS